MNVNDLLEIEDATGIVFQEHSARMTSEYVSRHRIKVGSRPFEITVETG